MVLMRQKNHLSVQAQDGPEQSLNNKKGKEAPRRTLLRDFNKCSFLWRDSFDFFVFFLDRHDILWFGRCTVFVT